MNTTAPVEQYCGAKTRAGTPCRRKPRPNGRCNLHGGKSLAGIASPTFRTGRYSKYLPDRLAGRFAESLSDPDLLELRAEIALTDGRLEDLLKRVDSGESGRAWAKLREHYKQMQAEPDRRQVHLAAILKVIASDSYDYDAWREIHSLIEHRRRLVESERKRIVEAQQYVTAQQAMTLIGAVLGIIKENVNDRDTLRAISTGINALVTADTR